MTTGEKVVAALTTSFMVACFVLAIASVPGPWLIIGGMTGSFTGPLLGVRANRRRERQRRDAFAERIQLIREGKLEPNNP